MVGLFLRIHFGKDTNMKSFPGTNVLSTLKAAEGYIVELHGASCHSLSINSLLLTFHQNLNTYHDNYESQNNS